MGKKLFVTTLIGAGFATLAWQNAILPHASEATEEPSPLYAGSAEVERIISLGENLQSIGYDLGECGANGIYTENIEKAVTWFQQNNGLKDNGVVNAETEQAIAEFALKKNRQENTFGVFPDGVSPVFMQSTLAKPDTEDTTQLREWQAGFMQLGYNLAPCYTSGTVDDKTTQAIRDFQIDQELYPVSGILDRRTQGVLQAKLDSKEEVLSAYELMASLAGTAETNNPEVQKLVRELRVQHLEEVTQHYITDKNVPEYVARDIQNAALVTGWDITYMFLTSGQESSNRAWAKADCDNCTATGAFQFIEQTWLGTLKKHGAKYGYQDIVSSITRKGKRYTVPDGEKGQYILDLRKDTKLSSLMAAEFARDNYNTLLKKLGQGVGRTEMYMAHFFGSSAAVKFINAYHDDPKGIAAETFSDEADVNKHVFYKGGDIEKPRTNAEVYGFFKNKIAPDGVNALKIGPAQKQNTPSTAQIHKTPSSSHA